MRRGAIAFKRQGGVSGAERLPTCNYVFYRNLQLVEKVKEIAVQKQCTPAQLALAWLLA